MSEAKSNWLGAAELGLVNGSYSSLVSQLFAARLMDWITVAVIPAR
jgi:hypothetical protein